MVGVKVYTKGISGIRRGSPDWRIGEGDDVAGVNWGRRRQRLDFGKISPSVRNVNTISPFSLNSEFNLYFKLNLIFLILNIYIIII